jgi:hypothetical protein
LRVVAVAMTKGCIWYSDCRPPPEILRASQATVERSGLPIVACTLQPIDWAVQRIVLPLERGPLTMFRQILAALEVLTTDIVFFCEHDVLYAREHFDFTPDRCDCYYYNQHVWKVRASDGHALHYRCNQTSGLCADRDLLLAHYRQRVALVEAIGFTRAMGFEPGTHNRPERVDNVGHRTWCSTVPNVDIRHDVNMTASRWSIDEFRNQRFTEGWTEGDGVPGWGVTRGRFDEFLRDVTRREVVA